MQKRPEIFRTALKCAIFIFILAALLSGCSLFKEPSPKEPGQEDRADEILKKMSLEEKAGQMIMIGLGEYSTYEEKLQHLQKINPCGVVLFDYDLPDKEETLKLIADLKKENRSLPLFMAVDLEGGPVARMRSFVAPPDAARDIGKKDPSVAKSEAVRIAKELKALGYNTDFAPVADIGFGKRSYGDTAKAVTPFVLAAAEGFSSQDLYFALKHFPGLGRGKGDTHTGTVVIDADEETLTKEDLAPFKAAMDKFPHDRFFLMVGHGVYPALGSKDPASISTSVVTGIARKKLGFEGLVITDDMEMGALQAAMTVEEAGVRAVEAGCDILLICHTFSLQEQARSALIKAVKEGRISEERIDASVRRIIKAKLALGLLKS